MINITKHVGEEDKVRAVLQRLVRMLDTLLEDGEPDHIDVAQLSLIAEERALLFELLGENGTQAVARDYGYSRISSTGIPGIWWVEHLDEMEHVIGEFIEVNYCPEVLIAATEDVREGREVLKARLFEEEMARKRRNSGK